MTLDSVLNIIMVVVKQHWHKDFCGAVTFNFFKGGIVTAESKEIHKIEKGELV